MLLREVKTFMRLPKISRSITLGLIFAGLYNIFYCATLFSWLTNANSDSQIAAAFVSSPTSVIVYTIFNAVIATGSGYGSVLRDVSTWAALFIAGNAQYFVVGYLAGNLFAKIQEK